MNAAGALAFLAESAEGNAAIIAAGGIDVLVRLSRGDDQAAINAGQALLVLTDSDDGVEAIKAAGFLYLYL